MLDVRIGALNTKPYLEGEGDAVLTPRKTISHIVTPVIPNTNLLSKPPLTPSLKVKTTAVAQHKPHLKIHAQKSDAL